MLGKIFHISPVGHTYSHLKTRHHPPTGRDALLTIPLYLCIFYIVFVQHKAKQVVCGVYPWLWYCWKSSSRNRSAKIRTWESTSPVAQNPTSIGIFFITSQQNSQLGSQLLSTILADVGPPDLALYTAWSQRKVSRLLLWCPRNHGSI